MQTKHRGWAKAAYLWAFLALLSPPGLKAQDPAAPAAEELPQNSLIFVVSSKTSNLTLIEKASRVIQLGARIRTVDGFDPTVVKVTTINNNPRQIRVQAVAPGVTSLVLVDEAGASYTLEIFVSGDVKQLEATIRKAFPDASVQAIKVKDSVLLLGWVNQPDQLTTIVEIAEQFHPKVLNYLRVSGIQQVSLQVKIMEVQREVIRTMGFNFLQQRANSFMASTPGAIAPLAAGATTAGVAGASTASLENPLTTSLGSVMSSAVNPALATATFGLVNNDNVFQGFLEALKQESLLKTLAEPNLITVNGRPANFLSGGEFPITVPQGLGTISIQFKPFGVKLEFVPIVLGNGRLRMEVMPEVSEKDFTQKVVVGSTTVPGLITRRVNTQVEMNFGQTLIIAGLINNRVQATTSKVPFLGELPWIGAAFRTVSYDESETELLVMVTPEFVAPLENDQVPPGGPGLGTVSPNDRELYGHGVLEVKRFAPDPEPLMDNVGDTPNGLAPPNMYMPADIVPAPPVEPAPTQPPQIAPAPQAQRRPAPPPAAKMEAMPPPAAAAPQARALKTQSRPERVAANVARPRGAEPADLPPPLPADAIDPTAGTRQRPPTASRQTAKPGAPGLVGPGAPPAKPAAARPGSSPGAVQRANHAADADESNANRVELLGGNFEALPEAAAAPRVKPARRAGKPGLIGPGANAAPAAAKKVQATASRSAAHPPLIAPQ